jgi:hypothetical protein
MRVVTIVAALLVGTAGFAMAQTGTSPGTPSGASSAGQCWDVSSNQVRSKTGGSSNTASNTGSSTDKMGSGSSAGSTVGSGSTASGSASARPAGMPNC